MKKNPVKLILDIVMSVAFVLLFKKNVISMAFHEIAGICICVLFIAHHLLNKNWIVAVTKNIFKKDCKTKIRIQYIVDVLLLIDVIVMLFTGIGINKTVSKTLSFLPKSAQIYHFFTAGLALILIGVHIGLHWKWIKGTVLGKLKDKITMPVKIISGVILAAFMGYGVYGVFTSNLRRWLSRPFIKNVAQGARQMKPRGPKGAGGVGHPPVPAVTFSSVMKVFIMFFSILILVSAVTSLVEYLITRKKKSDEVQE